MKKIKRILAALFILSVLGFAVNLDAARNKYSQPQIYKGKYFDFYIVTMEESSTEEVIAYQDLKASNHALLLPSSVNTKTTGKQNGVVREDYMIFYYDSPQILWSTDFKFESFVLGRYISLWNNPLSTMFTFEKNNKKIAVEWDETLSGVSCRRNEDAGIKDKKTIISLQYPWDWEGIISLLEECAEIRDIVISQEEKDAMSYALTGPIMTHEDTEFKRVLGYSKQVNNVKNHRTVNAIENIFNSIGFIMNKGM